MIFQYPLIADFPMNASVLNVADVQLPCWHRNVGKKPAQPAQVDAHDKFFNGWLITGDVAKPLGL